MYLYLYIRRNQYYKEGAGKISSRPLMLLCDGSLVTLHQDLSNEPSHKSIGGWEEVFPRLQSATEAVPHG